MKSNLARKLFPSWINKWCLGRAQAGTSLWKYARVNNSIRNECCIINYTRAMGREKSRQLRAHPSPRRESGGQVGINSARVYSHNSHYFSAIRRLHLVQVSNLHKLLLFLAWGKISTSANDPCYLAITYLSLIADRPTTKQPFLSRSLKMISSFCADYYNVGRR